MLYVLQAAIMFGVIAANNRWDLVGNSPGVTGLAIVAAYALTVYFPEKIQALRSWWRNCHRRHPVRTVNPTRRLPPPDHRFAAPTDDTLANVRPGFERAQLSSQVGSEYNRARPLLRLVKR